MDRREGKGDDNTFPTTTKVRETMNVDFYIHAKDQH